MERREFGGITVVLKCVRKGPCNLFAEATLCVTYPSGKGMVSSKATVREFGQRKFIFSSNGVKYSLICGAVSVQNQEADLTLSAESGRNIQQFRGR